MLQNQTDEEHPLSTVQICEKLIEMGISCDRRVLTKDIKALNDAGFEIMSFMRGHERVYYFEDRRFSIPEIKILMDSVQAASFITETKSKELVSKLAELGGRHRAELLKGSMVCFNTRKHTNESVYYNVSALEEAIQLQKKASFLYFDLDENCCRKYRKNKNRYLVNPMALVFHEDNYYLLTYTEKYEAITTYSVFWIYENYRFEK